MSRRRGRGRGRSRRLARRLWALFVLTPTLLVLSASRAVADSDVSRPAAALSWMDLHDSRGISIWDYDLSLDRGGVTSPLKLVWSVFADIGWHIYTWLVGSAMWLIDFTLSFGWLEPFEGPAEAVSDSLADVITRFGALPVILTVAGVIAAGLVMTGRFATGLYEFFAAALVAALAMGVLASPIHYVTGGDSWLIQARNLGLEVGGSLSAEDGRRVSDPDEIRQNTSEQLADIFIRAPHQLVNYNAVIDGTDCEEAYDAGLQIAHATWVKSTVDGQPGYRLVNSTTGDPINLPEGTTLAELYDIPDDKVGFRARYNDVPEQRDIVENCDSSLGDAAANPSFTQVINILALGLGGIFLAILALALCLAVWASAIYALVLAIKALINLITGILPGGQRLGLTRTISEVAIALIVVLAAVVFLMAYLQVVTAVFHSTDGPPMKRFAILDLLLIGGLVVWWRLRRSLKAAAATLAQKLATRPNAKPTKISSAFGADNPWATARKVGSHARQTAGTLKQGVVVGGRGIATAGRHSGRAAGAGAMTGFAGAWAGGRGAKWLADDSRQTSGRLGFASWAAGRDAASAGAGNAAATAAPGDGPTGKGATTMVPSGSPSGRPPRHSQASLARREAVRHLLTAGGARSPARNPHVRPQLVPPRGPTVPNVPRESTPSRPPAPRLPAGEFDRVVRDGHVLYLPRRTEKAGASEPTRMRR